jgi:hypothetical protein
MPMKVLSTLLESDMRRRKIKCSFHGSGELGLCSLLAPLLFFSPQLILSESLFKRSETGFTRYFLGLFV